MHNKYIYLQCHSHQVFPKKKLFQWIKWICGLLSYQNRIFSIYSNGHFTQETQIVDNELRTWKKGDILYLLTKNGYCLYIFLMWFVYIYFRFFLLLQLLLQILKSVEWLMSKRWLGMDNVFFFLRTFINYIDLEFEITRFLSIFKTAWLSVSRATQSGEIAD